MTESEAHALTRDEAIARLVELLDETDTTMLTTIDSDGRLVSRPMAYVPGAFD
ncbi:MAG: Pyridoxamine 5-phosphate oxidase like, partial [Jatrophihabitantaceae bacterium]|nr:Pyridoxamine 5-phosphate oxidase like [Jatrophihabitantaceae bacterium]